MITPSNKLKFKVRQNVYKEEIISELSQICTQQIDTINKKIDNFGILIKSKNKKGGQKRKMPNEITDRILINGLQSFGKFETLNPVEISFKSNNIMADLNIHKNYKYPFLMTSLLFSASVTNAKNVSFISFNALNDAK